MKAKHRVYVTGQAPIPPLANISQCHVCLVKYAQICGRDIYARVFCLANHLGFDLCDEYVSCVFVLSFRLVSKTGLYGHVSVFLPPASQTARNIYFIFCQSVL